MSSIRRFTIAAAVAAIGLLSACSTADNPPPAAAASTTPRILTVPPQPSEPVRTGQTTSSSAPKRFANKTLTVRLTDYDSKVDMFEFHLVRWIKGGTNNGHFEPDPADSAPHRLPMAKSAQILSAIGICSEDRTADDQNRGNKPCTKSQLIEALGKSIDPYAELKVDADDNIAKVTEHFTP